MRKKRVQDYCEILDYNLDFVLYNEVLTSGVLANYFKVLYSNKFMVHNDQLYKYNGVYWCLDESKKSSVLHQFISNHFYNHLVKYSLDVKSKIFKKLEGANENDSIAIKNELSKSSPEDWMDLEDEDLFNNKSNPYSRENMGFKRDNDALIREFGW